MLVTIFTHRNISYVMSSHQICKKNSFLSHPSPDNELPRFKVFLVSDRSFHLLLSSPSMKECQSKSCQWNNLAWKNIHKRGSDRYRKAFRCQKRSNNSRKKLPIYGGNIFVLRENPGMGLTVLTQLCSFFHIVYTYFGPSGYYLEKQRIYLPVENKSIHALTFSTSIASSIFKKTKFSAAISSKPS